MDRVTLVFVTFLSVLIVVAVASASNGNSTTRNATTTDQASEAFSPKPSPGCSLTDFCCKLGRKAVRRLYTSLYTCRIEALIKGLEYQSSASHRLKPRVPADRMKAASNLHTSYGFRSRLHLCQTARSSGKQCFQECCERRLSEKKARAKAKAAEKRKNLQADRGNLSP